MPRPGRAKFDSSLFDKKKELPLFQLVLDLASLLYKYNGELMIENIWNRTLMISDDLFCTGDLRTRQDCVVAFD